MPADDLNLLVLLVITDLQQVAPQAIKAESHVQRILKLVRRKNPWKSLPSCRRVSGGRAFGTACRASGEYCTSMISPRRQVYTQP